jgi:hypothetical protein
MVARPWRFVVGENCGRDGRALFFEVGAMMKRKPKAAPSPGPWRYDDPYLRNDRNEIIAEVGWGLADNEADAALIAAAPDLLAVLRELVAAQDCVCRKGATCPAIESAIKAARAAIRKATRRQP